MKKWILEEGYVDCHVHLADSRISADLAAILARARAQGIHNFSLAGVDPSDWARSQLLADREKGIFPSFGMHPYFVAKAGVEECEAALELLEQKLPQALALGECGLDFRTVHLGQEPESAKAKQRLFFERQLEMAKRARKVPILHVVRAHSEALNCLVDRTERGYLLHSFHAEIETSRRHLDRGAYLSVSGSLLRKGAHRLEDSIRNAPMERILLESDAPDQHPDPTLGAVNEPTTILLVAKRIAELKKSSEEKVLEQARDNFRELFRTEFIEGIAPK